MTSWLHHWGDTSLATDIRQHAAAAAALDDLRLILDEYAGRAYPHFPEWEYRIGRLTVEISRKMQNRFDFILIISDILQLC